MSTAVESCYVYPVTTGRTGRRTGEPDTRGAILRAARELFAESGFSRTTLRAVAARAGCDVALIPYYFSSKRGLFVAAMELPIDAAAIVGSAADGPREHLGERLAAAFVTVWDDPDTGPAMRGFLRASISDETIAGTFGEFLSQELLPLIAERVGISRDTAKVLISMMFGMAVMRRLVAVPAFAEHTTDELIAMLGPRLQSVIDFGDTAGASTRPS